MIINLRHIYNSYMATNESVFLRSTAVLEMFLDKH